MTLLKNYRQFCSKLEVTQRYSFLVILTYAFFFSKKLKLMQKYSDLLRMFDLSQLISEATRVTSSSSSLIDHILSNNCDKICQSGTITIGLSDHFLTYMTRKVVKGQIGKHKFVKVRSLKCCNK